MNSNIIELTEVNLSDAPYILELENDPLNSEFSTLSEAPYSLSEIRLFCKKCEFSDIKNLHKSNNDSIRLIIKHQQQRVGIVDLYELNRDQKEVWVSIIVYPESNRAKGIGTAALNLLTDLCKEHLTLDELHAEINIDNLASQQLFNSCGFTLYSTNSKDRVNYLKKSINQPSLSKSLDQHLILDH